MRVEPTEFRIVFCGGGTAGHVMPGIAVLQALQRMAPGTYDLKHDQAVPRRINALWVASERIESEIVPSYGISFRQLDIRFSYRRLVPRNWPYYKRHILPLLMGHPFRQALNIIDVFQPHLVVGTGGYVAAPALWAAQHRGIPYVLIQCDCRPGLVNWFFADQAARVYAATQQGCHGFAGRTAIRKRLVAGFPVVMPRQTRGEFLTKQQIDPAKRVVLMMGGSLGAGAIQKMAREVLDACAKHAHLPQQELALLNICGERDMQSAHTEANPAQAAPGMAYRCLGYVEHAVDAVFAADFYVGRSGAATVGELLAAGIPSLLIPDPQHEDRQQYMNAAALVEHGTGTILDQRRATGADVAEWLADNWQQPRRPVENVAADVIAADILSRWGG